jgi:ABC-2 type transport system permease protein
VTTAALPERNGTMWIFGALCRRELRVARRELPFFLLRTTLQPLLVVIVFGFMLPRMGFVQGGYGGALLPGICAISLMLSSMMSVSFPMIVDFGVTKEIEDRLLAPIDMKYLALTKVLWGSVAGLIAVLFLLPVARLIMGPIAGLTVSHFALVILFTLLGAGAFSTFALWLGTVLNPEQIGLMFGVILTPMIFFGCAYYPWQAMSVVPVLKYIVLINPLVYVAEGLRGTLTPTLPHMPVWASLVGLLVINALFWTMGIRTFRKRALG